MVHDTNRDVCDKATASIEVPQIKGYKLKTTWRAKSVRSSFTRMFRMEDAATTARVNNVKKISNIPTAWINYKKINKKTLAVTYRIPYNQKHVTKKSGTHKGVRVYKETTTTTAKEFAYVLTYTKK